MARYSIARRDDGTELEYAVEGLGVDELGGTGFSQAEAAALSLCAMVDTLADERAAWRQVMDFRQETQEDYPPPKAASPDGASGAGLWRQPVSITCFDSEGNRRKAITTHIEKGDVNEDGTVNFPVSGCPSFPCDGCGNHIPQSNEQ